MSSRNVHSVNPPDSTQCYFSYSHYFTSSSGYNLCALAARWGHFFRVTTSYNAVNAAFFSAGYSYG